MTRLPTGTVTFLFTDVEGSTKLLEQLGEQYHEVQDRHASIIRAAVTEGGGSVVSTEGDSFFAVFPDAQRAVSAAVQADRELATAPWPASVRLRVRMGLHTGAAILGGDNYLGLDVNRAARIAAAAHGEQILLSDATQSLVEKRLPPGTRLRGLGQHRFKNLTEPQRLYQVVIDGLEQDFPPPRTLDIRPNNLPVQLTNFIGRRSEVASFGKAARRQSFADTDWHGRHRQDQAGAGGRGGVPARLFRWRLLRGPRSHRRRQARGVGDRFHAKSSGERR